MTETYTLAITGTPADDTIGTAAQKTVLIGDSGCPSPGGEGQAMTLNTQILCKLPDGQKAWFTYDAERSLPGVTRVMKRVSP